MHIAQALRQVGNAVLDINLRAEVRDLFKRMKAYDQEAPFAAAPRSACQTGPRRSGSPASNNNSHATSIPPPSQRSISSSNTSTNHWQSSTSPNGSASRSPLSSTLPQRHRRNPAAYYLRLRCQRAAECLRADPDRSIQSIAHGLGFEDARCFDLF